MITLQRMAVIQQKHTLFLENKKNTNTKLFLHKMFVHANGALQAVAEFACIKHDMLENFMQMCYRNKVHLCFC